jgi:hypothetical protein
LNTTPAAATTKYEESKPEPAMPKDRRPSLTLWVTVDRRPSRRRNASCHNHEWTSPPDTIEFEILNGLSTFLLDKPLEFAEKRGAQSEAVSVSQPVSLSQLLESHTMRIQFLLITAIAVIGGGRQASAVEFYEYPDPFDSVEVIYPDDIGGPYWPESNLIQGAGVGFEEDEPHDKIGAGELSDWVTTDDCGYPADYIDCVGTPVIRLDLGQDVLLDEISTWGYSDMNTNGMREFELRFATDAEGPTGYGTSISYNPTFIVEDYFEFLAIERRSFEFSEQVTARYVELTATDNYFDDPGDGSGEEGWGPGGDRVGIGEIAFRVPEVTGLVGDFNSDGVLDAADIDDLTQQSASGANDANYDLTSDGSVDLADVNEWISAPSIFNSWIGDANLDKEFNSSDLVAVLAAGAYESDVDAVWSTGDFNGDGRANTGDLVAALAGGGYETGPRTGVAAVPEPSGLLIVLGGLGMLAHTRVKLKPRTM